MMGTPPNERPDCFWRADLLAAATHLVEICARCARRCSSPMTTSAGTATPTTSRRTAWRCTPWPWPRHPSFRPDLGEAHRVAKVYWTAFPKSVLRAGIQALRETGQATGFAAMDPDDLPMGVDDSLVTTAIDGGAYFEAKLTAMRAHATQIDMNSGFFALSDNIGSPAMAVEYFRLVRGVGGGPFDADGRETDLFAGL